MLTSYLKFQITTRWYKFRSMVKYTCKQGTRSLDIFKDNKTYPMYTRETSGVFKTFPNDHIKAP